MAPHSTRNTDSHRFIPGLESVRGLAALTVCLFHTGQIKLSESAIIPAHSSINALFNAHGAVVLFFVLSGFVLRLSLANKWSQPIAIVASGYLVGRFFRLFPVIVVTVLICAAVRWICDANPVSAGELLRNAALIDTSLNGVFWTLQVEVFGSVLVLVVFLIERRTHLLVVAGIAAALLPFSFLGHSWILQRPIFSILYPFMFGYFVAAYPQANRPAPIQSGVLLVAALIVFYGAGAQGFVLKGWLLLLTTISSTLVVNIVSTNHYRALEWRPIRVLGLLSYSSYSLHPLGLRVAQAVASALSEKATVNWLIILTTFFIAIAASVLFAAGMYFVVERPGNSISHRLRNLIGRQMSAA